MYFGQSVKVPNLLFAVFAQVQLCYFVMDADICMFLHEQATQWKAQYNITGWNHMRDVAEWVGDNVEAELEFDGLYQKRQETSNAFFFWLTEKYDWYNREDFV